MKNSSNKIINEYFLKEIIEVLIYLNNIVYKKLLNIYKYMYIIKKSIC